MLSDSETSHPVYTICDVSYLNMTKLLILRNSKIPKPFSDVYNTLKGINFLIVLRGFKLFRLSFFRKGTAIPEEM